ncbi:MAG: hypothetical protein DVB29_00185 [Verrucomicrobia bacterium]|nr:MAG: hypothetical protein DVB29_00185 [Verrucomicrobiota bacterium]
MDAALDSHFDLDSMYTYSPASKCSSALPHQPSRSPRHDQYEICGLKPGQSPPRSPDRRWCLHQDSRRLATNQYEICGLSGNKTLELKISFTPFLKIKNNQLFLLWTLCKAVHR